MTTRSGTVRMPWDAANPYPYYAIRRRDGDVVWDEELNSWLVFGYRAAQQVLSANGWSSNPLVNPNAPETLRGFDRDVVRRNLTFTDGADHTRLRKAVRDVFTRSFIARLEEGVEAIARDIVDAIPAGEEFDFMTEVALPLPIAVAAAWLGLDVDAARLLYDEAPAISRMLFDFNDTAAVDAGLAAFATLLTELLPLAADRRVHPGDDLLSFIAADRDLELDDVVITALIIADAGRLTTANLLGKAMIRLLTPGEDGARPVDGLPAVDDRLVTELLRLDAPVQNVPRTATEDHVVGGMTIRAGEAVQVLLAAANRDPAVYSEPDRLRLDRPGPAPLTFGHGVHYCLGAALARLEVGTTLRRALARAPRLGGAPQWADTQQIHGPVSVPMTFGH